MIREVPPDEIVKDISNTILGLFLDKPSTFYATYLTCLQKECSKKAPTIQVELHQIDYKLVSNPYFWQSLSKREKEGVLIHEVMHIMYNHPMLSLNYANRELHNIACDLFINYHIIKEGKVLPGSSYTKNAWDAQFLPKLEELKAKRDQMSEEEFNKEFYSIPVRGVFPDCYPEFTSEEIEKGTNYIYNKLEKIHDQKGDPRQQAKKLLEALGKAANNEWGDCQTASKEKVQIVGNQVKHKTKQAAEALSAKQQGDLPGHLRDMIEAILNPPKPITDWKKVIRNWIGGFGTANLISRTHMRPNLIIEDQPVLRIKRNKHLALAWDTSGSMGQKEILHVVKESLNIKLRTKCKITIIECDAYVDEKEGVYELTSVEQIQDRMKKGMIRGGGGTSVDPVIEYIQKRPDVTGLIYMTDGYLSEPTKYPMIPFLTVVSQDGADLDWDCPVLKIPEDYDKL